jgi:cyclopropane-fatty-acyl-phospholipid synthase
MVSQKGTSLKALIEQSSHAKWLSVVQAAPAKRFWYEGLVESGLVPDALIRAAIRKMLRDRLQEEDRGTEEANREHLRTFVEQMKQSPIALCTDSANAQHYEVPAAFFEAVLGPRLKYSSALYADDCRSLGEAEQAMLRLTSERAELFDGQDVLELGCGWGSLTLWMAQHYPNSRITGVSNSSSQREFILSRAAARDLRNIQIVTADMNEFAAPGTYDRVVSVEMFEHMRNWELLLGHVAGWMKPEAKLFLHVFTHRKFAYAFEVRGKSDWMAQRFFTGGMMPSENLLQFFDHELRIAEHWVVGGTHYQKTSQDWLRNMDSAKSNLLPLFTETYGKELANRWWIRWRIFFMACAELWGYRQGREWNVSHYLLEKQKERCPAAGFTKSPKFPRSV